jgi:hypothetical protein
MIYRSQPHTRWLVALSAAISLGVAGCSDGESEPPLDGFVSANPANPSFIKVAEGGPPLPPGTDQGASDPETDVAVAEVLQVKDDKLYALSQYSGLSIIDISVKDQLTVLGRYPLDGIPFEMHLRGGILYAIFSSFQDSEQNAVTPGYHWVGTSHIEALDVTLPASIRSVGSFELPGKVSDSRVIGDVLYTVTSMSEEDPNAPPCSGCGILSNTSITSLSVADPAKIAIVDQRSSSESDPSRHISWGNRVSIGPQRLYVAGDPWLAGHSDHSTIQVIDISDPTGLLTLGATVEAAGIISRASQMDEHDGVLRVISQPDLRAEKGGPKVQTFSVLSAKDVKPLGTTELTVPTPDKVLASVRFDGARAYATATSDQKKDWFSTIDLSDPAAPRQAGGIEMDRLIFHLEPRGDRLLVMSYGSGAPDDKSPAGSIDVSLLDVSNLAAPAVIQTIGTGGAGASLIGFGFHAHPPFTIVDDAGLLLFPYGKNDLDDKRCEPWAGGVELIEFTANTLTLRGAAPSRGKSQRAFLQSGRLFAVSGAEVQTFNIDDRSAPAAVIDVALTANAVEALAMSDHVVRLREEPWKRLSHLDVMPATDPGGATPLGTLDLTPLRSSGPLSCGSADFADARMFENGKLVYLVWPSIDWRKTRVAIIDVQDPTQPKITGQLDLDAQLRGTDYVEIMEVVAPGRSAVQSGSTLVFRRIAATPVKADQPGDPPVYKGWLEVVDLSDPANPAHAATVELPVAAGHLPLQIEGSTVLTSHWVPVPKHPDKARFYLDRIDVSIPSSPKMSDPVNVPGSLVAFYGDTGKLLTADHQLIKTDVPVSDCKIKFGPREMPSKGCEVQEHSFKLVDVSSSPATVLTTVAIENGPKIVRRVLVGDDRVFAEASPSGGFSSIDHMVLGGIKDGDLKVTSSADELLATSQLVAVDGKRVFSLAILSSTLGVLDATNLDAVTFEQKGKHPNATLHGVEFTEDSVLCSEGQYGLQVIPLGD